MRERKDRVSKVFSPLRLAIPLSMCHGTVTAKARVGKARSTNSHLGRNNIKRRMEEKKHRERGGEDESESCVRKVLIKMETFGFRTKYSEPAKDEGGGGGTTPEGVILFGEG